jgi:hypothetical protein
MKFMLKSYSNTIPIIKNGKHIVNKKRVFPDGLIDLDRTCFSICGKEIPIYLVIE